MNHSSQNTNTINEEVKAYLVSLHENELIPKELIEDIINSGNINLIIESYECTLLQIIRYADQIDDKMKQDIIIKLLNFGANPNVVDKPSVHNYTPLVWAVESNLTDIIPHLLNKMDNPLSPYRFGMNVLHCAVSMKNKDALKILMKDKRLQESLYLEDMWGRTPIEIACREGDDESLLIMLNRELSVDEKKRYHYGEKQDFIGQGTLIEFPVLGLTSLGLNQKLALFENILKKRNGQPDFESQVILDNEGLCNGWSFLHNLYPDAIFHDILTIISRWDGTEENLKNLVLPGGLYKYFTNMNDLLESITHWLVVFQTTTLPFNFESPTRLRSQEDRYNQFNLVKADKDTRTLEYLVEFPRTFLNLDQLTTLIKAFQKLPNMMSDVSLPGHATSLKVYQNGLIHYYDSNFPFRTPPSDDAVTVARQIFASQGLNSNEQIYIAFGLQELLDKNQPKMNLSVFSKELGNDFLFNELHQSVFSNDNNNAEKNVKNNNQLILQKDLFGNSALRYAYESGNFTLMNSILNGLMNTEPIDTKIIKKIFLSEKDDLNTFLLTKCTHFFDFSMIKSQALACFNKILNQTNLSDFNCTDCKQRTFLHLAVMSNDLRLVNNILKHDIKIHAKDSDGKTAMDYAKESRNSHIYQLLVDHQKKQLTQNSERKISKNDENPSSRSVRKGF